MTATSLPGEITAYCRGCRVERRFRFVGYATETGAENTVRPRAERRRCATCSLDVLRLADVTDVEALAANVVEDWRRAVARDVSGLDLDDANGYLLELAWKLYNEWRPDYGDGRIGFSAYALGIMRRRFLDRWVAVAAGTVREHRNGHGRTALRYPKAHSLGVSESYDLLLNSHDDYGATGGADDASADRPGPRRLAFALGAVQADFADDRAPDLGRLLDVGDR